MALAETLTQLESVQEAISKLETNAVKSYTLDGRVFTYQDLETLYKREERLIKRYNLEQGNKPAVGAFKLGGFGY